MTVLKYSKQRESIKEYLANTNEHPSADTVYLKVRETFPNISLGTVYRNLNLLTELGEITKITTPGGSDRFDGITDPHYHFYCNRCGKVLDVELEKPELTGMLKTKDFGGHIDSYAITFYGECGNCTQ